MTANRLALVLLIGMACAQEKPPAARRSADATSTLTVLD
jgi:hypothetical protein